MQTHKSTCLQDMSAGENLRLQHLFEDSMSTLTTTVETLSHSLTTEVAALKKCVRVVTQADEDDAAVRSASLRACAVLIVVQRAAVCTTLKSPGSPLSSEAI